MDERAASIAAIPLAGKDGTAKPGVVAAIFRSDTRI